MTVLVRVLALAAIATLLLVVPISGDGLNPIAGSQPAFADKGGGGHEGGPDGKGGPSGNSGHGPAGNGTGHAFGRGVEANGVSNNGNSYGNAFGLANGASNLSKSDPMHPSNLGRLTGFFNASSQALASTSSNSAIGTLSKTYRDRLSDYLSDPLSDPNDLNALADAVAAAANKQVSAEQVKAINERLALENPQDPNLAGLSNPTNDPTVEAQNDALANDIAIRANEIQAAEENQGLGQRIAGFFEDIF